MMSTPFTELVGCQVPIQQAGIGGYTSAALAIAVSGAGGLGMLSGAIERDALDAQLDSLPDGAVVGVNFLMPFLDRDAMAAAASRSRFIEFFWADPDAELVAIVHDAGALASWQVGSVDEALAACDAGCDVVVAQGIEAGGHVRGVIGLLPLLAELRPKLKVPLIAAGGIGTGRGVAAALTAGADAVRVGTRFLAATESIAHADYVDALIRSSASDTVITTAFCDGWPDAPHRILREAIATGEALGDDQRWTPDWPGLDCPTPPLARALYAGQSVGAVSARQPAAEIVRELMEETEATLAR